MNQLAPSRLGTIAALTVFLSTCGLGRAGSLRDTLDDLVTFGGVPAPNSPALETIATLDRVAVASADRPPTAAVPGFFYRFDVEAGAPERISMALSPVFAEPAETVGARKIDVGLSYLYSDFTELDGQSLSSALDGLRVDPAAQTLLRVDVDRFTLVSHTLLVSATYGLSDRWDVNCLAPLIMTRMNLSAKSLLGVALVGEFETRVHSSQEKFGVGDVLLRSKYRLPDYAGFKFASLLSVRTPSGDEANFQGLGDVIVTPLLVAARNFGRHDVHLNAGIDVNASELEASRARYALGASLYLLDSLSVLVDLVGTSSVSEYGLRERFGSRSVAITIERTNILDVYFGFKALLRKNLLLHVGALVPVTDDGLRADVVPTGGLEATF